MGQGQEQKLLTKNSPSRLCKIREMQMNLNARAAESSLQELVLTTNAFYFTSSETLTNCDVAFVVIVKRHCVH